MAQDRPAPANQREALLASVAAAQAVSVFATEFAGQGIAASAMPHMLEKQVADAKKLAARSRELVGLLECFAYPGTVDPKSSRVQLSQRAIVTLLAACALWKTARSNPTLYEIIRGVEEPARALGIAEPYTEPHEIDALAEALTDQARPAP